MKKTKRNCDNCGKTYFADNRNLKRGWGLCCSKSCSASKREKSRPNYDPVRVAENNEKQFQKIEGQTELELKDLIRKYEDREFSRSLTIEKGSFNYILGGDGRSSPYDEKREGIVLKMEIPEDYFVSSEDVNKFGIYLKMTTEAVQAIFINQIQILPK